MNKIKLNAESRSEKNGQARQIRRDGYIPAVIYGRGIKNRDLKMKRIDFEKVFSQAGESNLIDLVIDKEEPIKVIVKDSPRDALKGNIIHADFYQVDMNKKITTELPISFIGESKAVRELGGVLVKNMHNIEVECLPGDLAHHFEVDLSKLEAIHDSIRISDISLPSGVTALNKQDDIIVNVVEQKVEKEPVEETTVEGDEEKDGKEETDEAKEGESSTTKNEDKGSK